MVICCSIIETFWSFAWTFTLPPVLPVKIKAPEASIAPVFFADSL